jgi:hypothetical protein
MENDDVSSNVFRSMMFRGFAEIARIILLGFGQAVALSHSKTVPTACRTFPGGTQKDALAALAGFDVVGFCRFHGKAAMH